MVRTFFTGMSGIEAHQGWLDVIANDVANINTIGHKDSRVTFQEQLSIYAKQAVGPRVCNYSRGGMGSKQIGLGVVNGTIDVIHTQGSFEDSDKVTDLAISGDGYFILNDSRGNRYYTRAGAFDFDAHQNLVNSANGMFVQGWMSKWDQVVSRYHLDTGTPIGNIVIKMGEILPAKTTEKVVFDGNLNANTPTAIPSMITTQNVSLRGLSQVVDGDAPNPVPGRNCLALTAPVTTNALGRDHAGWTIPINPNSRITINGWTSEPLSTYSTVNELIGVINNSSAAGVTMNYNINTDMFTISADIAGTPIYLHQTSALSGLFTAMHMPTGFHQTTIETKVKFTHLLDPQHPDRHYYRWEAVNPATEEAVPMVESATSSILNMGPNGTNLVSGTHVQGLDITQPFHAAGFDVGQTTSVWTTPLDVTSRIRIRTSSYAGEGSQSVWISAPLSEYVSVSQFMAAVNNQMSAPVTITYNPVADTFTVINDVPGTAVMIEDINVTPGRVGFTTAAKFQAYTALNLAANTLWNGQTQGYNGIDANRTAVFNATTLPAKGIIQLDSQGKVIENYIDTDENSNNVLDRTSEIPGITAVSTVASMPPTIFGGALWSHTTQRMGTGLDYARLTNGQIRESVVMTAIQTVVNFGRNDVDPSRLVVTINQKLVNSAAYTFSNNTGPGGVDQLVFHPSVTPLCASDPAERLSADDLIELNYVRLGYSNLKPTDLFIPNGNEGPEAITFSPNTSVANYKSYDPDDDITNGFPELADHGDPVTTARLSSDKYLYNVTQEVYDSQGNGHEMVFIFEKLDTNYWLWTVRNPAEDKLAPEGKLAGYGTLIFNHDGSYNRHFSETFQSPSDPATYDGDNGESQTGRTTTIGYRGIYFDPPELYYPSDFGGSPPPEKGTSVVRIEPNFQALFGQVDLILKTSSVKASQDGYKMGRLKGITIDYEGIIWGNYTNEKQMPKAQIALANFNNPGGLDKKAGTIFKKTANSGEAIISTPANSWAGNIISKKLERSTVTLAKEFIEMILAERGFQANSRSISTADRIIMDLMRMRM